MNQPNHLIREKSPYLLQHAHNPVDWYPWGEEAFEKARREDKPILLSIGYSTCHWCHVMERESFSNPEIAGIMNENLVSIKVDREERPDVDKIYMTAVTAMTGSGGWPLNVFLTPDLKPFYGGTYFPPEDRWGRVGWPELVKKIGITWRDPEERKKIMQSAENLTEHIGTFQSEKAAEGDLNLSSLEDGFRAFQGDYDSVLGGFGGAPKFPMPVNHNFLFRFYGAFKQKKPKQAQEALQMSLHTLQAMAKGGIYDQLGGGFARYSTDERWHVPHFEKMLYDNAQLIPNYLEAYLLGHDEVFARIAKESLNYVLRDMTDAGGGFYSAEDADSLSPELAGKASQETHAHKSEGAFYLWDRKEVMKILGNESGEIFSFLYGVLDHGNAESDPQGEFTDKNILFLAKTIGETAELFGKSDEEIKKIIEKAREKLFAVRSQRPRPHLDDKLITSWNGLMISALVKAHQVFGEEKHLQAAEKAAHFIEQELYDPQNKQIYRRWRDGERKIPGVADDYAFFAQGCLDLYETDFDVHWFNLALSLTDELLKRFYDRQNGGFFMTEEGKNSELLFRTKEDHDNVEPSAGSIGTLNLLRLARMTGKEEYRKFAEKTLKSYSAQMKNNPRAFPQMLAAVSFAIAQPTHILIVGDKNNLQTQAFIKEVNQRFLPNKSFLLFKDRGAVPQELGWVSEILKSAPPSREPVTAYVCENYACHLPTSDLSAFREILEGSPVER